MQQHHGLINPPPMYAPGLRGFFQRRAKRWRFWMMNSGWKWKAFFGNPIALIAWLIIGLFGLLALFQPLLLSNVLDQNIYDPLMGYDLNLTHPSLPSGKHIFGTDYLGRDVFSQLALASRTSFGVGIVAALVGTIVATIIGVVAAYFEGIFDTFLMMVTDVFIMLPPAVILLIVGLVFEMTWVHVGLIYGIFAGLGSFALMVKVQALAIKTKNYTQAARVAGGGHWRIISVHILPNLAALITVNMMFIVTGSVMIEALLSYFDRSVRFSWGSMIWLTIDNFRGGAEGLQWHVLLAPAIAIMLFCGSFYMLARTLDEVVTPKLRKR
jgi:peptide/nickel transport system permease protein